MRLPLLLSLIALPILTKADEPTVTAENFDSLHQLMQPRAEELKWKEIPWHANLWSARVEAAKQGKPIYLWEMDGHPLGCT